MTEWMSRQHLFYGQYEGKVRSVRLLPGICSRGVGDCFSIHSIKPISLFFPSLIPRGSATTFRMKLNRN